MIRWPPQPHLPGSFKLASVINTNTASLVAQRNLATSQSVLNSSIKRLSSGMRIQSAKDDAAGLGISQKLQAQITGATVAARNANDAISMVSTAEGGMQEVSALLQRMRQLATQGNNDALDTPQRGYITTEINALRSEINQVGTRTTFNGKSLLNGSISDGLAGTAASADYQPASANYQAASADYQPASADYQPASANYQAASPNYQAASVNYQAASVDYQAASTDYQAASADYQAASADYQPATAYQPASADYQAATPYVATYVNFSSTPGDEIIASVGDSAIQTVVLTGTDATQAASDINASVTFQQIAVASVSAGSLVITAILTGSSAVLITRFMNVDMSPEAPDFSNNTANVSSGTDQVGTAAVAGTAQVGTAQVGTAQVGAAQVGTAQVGTAQVGTAQLGTAQVGTAQVGTAAVAGTAVDLRFQVGTASADDTTDISALFENVKIDTAENGSNFDGLNTKVNALTTGGATSAEMGSLTASVDTAIATIAGYRSNLGAMSNRLDRNMANLQTQQENLSASMSRIMDTDYAAETAALSKSQVMQQAATAMLAQANQMPNAVLTLLQ